jgi:transcriptional activator for dhaKLM operon
MQPDAFPVDLAQLTRQWTRFVENRVLPPGIDPLVSNSWRRCAPLLNPYAQPPLARLNPDTLQRVLISQFDLIAIARPLMEDINQFIEGGDSLIALLDSTGCVLAVLGSPGILERAGRFGLAPGTFWDEGRVGTNAFALAQVERTPALVMGPEHYLTCFHDLVDVAAPIFHPNGYPAGVIGLLCEAQRGHPHTLGIVVAAARALDNQLAADSFTLDANRHLTLLNATLESISEGVLAWNTHGVVTQLNKQAARLLGLNPYAVVGHSLRQVVHIPAEIQALVDRGENIHSREAELLVHGRPVQCVLTLVPIQAGAENPAGYLATLQPIEQIHDLYHRLAGTQATLTLEDIKGQSASVQRVRQQARTAARGRGNVLLQGESGVGKHVVARAIHNASARAGGPFVAINCRAIPRDLFLSEFLGYEGGAFSGARAEGRPSKFELASGGTLFLDEVDAIPREFQSALGRVIETGEVMRLGGTRTIPVNLRIIASTDVDIDNLVVEGNFQANLLYRLSSIVIDIPPLRSHREDLPELIETILARMGRGASGAAVVTPAALAVLMLYPWPGNVRELENVMERASSQAPLGQPIDIVHLPEAVRRSSVIVPTRERVEPVLSFDEWNREGIIRAGWATQGNAAQMAAMLGISRTTLWRKMKAYNLDIHTFQSDGNGISR